MAKTANRSRRGTSSTASFNGTLKSMPFYTDIMNIAGSMLRSRQEMGSEKIASVAQTTRNFAGEFNDIPNIQTYVEAAADQMENLSEYVADTSLEDMITDATTVARHNPVATLAFTAVVGFAITRMFAGHRSEGDASTSGSNRGRSKATASRSRSTSGLKAKANGRDTAHASANAA